MITIALAHRNRLQPPPPQPSQRWCWWLQRSAHRKDTVTPLPDLEPIQVSIGLDCGSLLLLCGSAGYGKSVAANIWALRLIRAGARVVILRAENNQDHNILKLPIFHCYRGVAVPYGAELEIVLQNADLIVMDDVPNHQVRPVAAVLDGITQCRMNDEQPIVVIVDAELPPTSIVPQMTNVLDIWLALNLHCWFVSQSAEELTQAILPLQRSLWNASHIRCLTHTPYYHGVVLPGFSEAEVRYTHQFHLPGEIAIARDDEVSIGRIVGVSPEEKALIEHRQIGGLQNFRFNC